MRAEEGASECMGVWCSNTVWEEGDRVATPLEVRPGNIMVRRIRGSKSSNALKHSLIQLPIEQN